MFSFCMKRMGSFFVDTSFIYLSTLIILKTLDLNVLFKIFVLISGFVALFYFVLFWQIFNGQTLGSKIFNIKVLSVNDEKMKFIKSLLRAGVITTIIIAPLNLVTLCLALINLLESMRLLFLSKNNDFKQAYWDLASNSYVVEKIRDVDVKGK